MSEREEMFEKMMQSVLDSYNSAVEKMDEVVEKLKKKNVSQPVDLGDFE